MSKLRSGDERMREARVEAAWRCASAEEPSPESDAAILAAAREQVRRPAPSSAARRPPSRWTRWQPLAAAAGVATLALVLVQRLPTTPGGEDSLPAPAASAPTASAETEMRAPSAAPVVPRPQERTGSADAPRTLSQPAAGQLPVEVADRAATAAGSTAAEAASPPARPEMNALPMAKSALEAPAAEDWIRRIVALHEAGDLPAAAAELRAFRSRYPDADALLPAELAAWAATVGPDPEP